ncbi:MAG TPA: NrfD/PsrC family molybdoenzyme membrane anchor subunit [Hyphomicrobiaceae bacterium]|jgi:formate-dependent nitrite reductase membrane component NrfD|nr:NrfD/PsrC family molybdoenzyme membrane anchor subunit [Hyphomicrobiaceae bacterium]
MNPPPSTLFTAAPEWQWLIVFYFFLGGIAGGAYVLAVLIDLFGNLTARPLARLGYLMAFPLTVVCGLLLIVDLRRPARFWHMMLQSETLRPMFKAWSPMSLGSWALLLFGGLALLSFLAALADDGRGRCPRLAVLRPPGALGTLVALVGGLLGFFVAGYTGVLLSATNRPIWADTSMLGLVFLVSGASTAAAALALLGRRRAAASPAGLTALERFDSMMLVLELVALIALVVSLGGMARAWLGAWGALLLIGVVGLGIIVPLVLYRRSLRTGGLSGAGAAAAALVLVGGFLLRVVIILSSESI